MLTTCLGQQVVKMLETVKEKLAPYRVRAVLVVAMLMGLVSSVSAVSMFAGVEDILAEVVLIIPKIVDLVIAAICSWVSNPGRRNRSS